MDIKINEDGTFNVVNGDIELVTGQDAIAQDIRSAIHTIRGEYFLDSSVGINYFGEILIKNYDPIIIENAFKNAILSRPGVLQITNFIFDVNKTNRTATLNFSVKTIEGEIDITEAIEI